MAVQFQKAARTAVKLKIGMQGPSGSGKTLGALALAVALAEGRRVAVVDTENGSASLYADRFDFDTLNLDAPYTSARYLEAIQAAVDGGYGAVVVDSLSHQWVGAGGILARKELLDARGGNSFTNWAQFTKEHEAFKAALLAAPLHVIGTLRTKSDYVLEKNDRGKELPKKVGTAAIQREGLEYELSIVFELQMDHRAAPSKDRTGLFDGELVDLTDRSTGRRLLEWLASATPAPVLTALDRAKRVRFPFHKGKPEHEAAIDTLPDAMLLSALDGARTYREQKKKPDAFAEFYEAALLVLDARGVDVSPPESDEETDDAAAAPAEAGPPESDASDADRADATYAAARPITDAERGNAQRSLLPNGAAAERRARNAVAEGR